MRIQLNITLIIVNEWMEKATNFMCIMYCCIASQSCRRHSQLNFLFYLLLQQRESQYNNNLHYNGKNYANAGPVYVQVMVIIIIIIREMAKIY